MYFPLFVIGRPTAAIDTFHEPVLQSINNYVIDLENSIIGVDLLVVSLCSFLQISASSSDDEPLAIVDAISVQPAQPSSLTNHSPSIDISLLLLKPARACQTVVQLITAGRWDSSLRTKSRRMQTAWGAQRSSAGHSDRFIIKRQGSQHELIVNLLINYV